MMPFGYPVMLEVAGRRCVVIGSGAVREGKVEGLLAAGAADVLVVSTGPRAHLDELERIDGVAVERRPWRADDLNGAWVVVAASPKAGERDAIAREARATRARERDGRHPQLRLVGPEHRAPGRPRARDRDGRRLAGPGEEAPPAARVPVRRGMVRDPHDPPCRARGNPPADARPGDQGDAMERRARSRGSGRDGPRGARRRARPRLRQRLLVEVPA